MINPEKSLAEQTAPDGSAATDSKILGYAEVFCRAMRELNGVALGQTEGLLNLAVTAAEKYRSINPSVVSAQAKTEELSEFIEQMKNAADKMSRTNQTAAEKTATHPAPNPDAVLAVVEQSLGNAIENSASNQQALNQIGAAILSRAAVLLLSADGSGASKPVTE